MSAESLLEETTLQFKGTNISEDSEPVTKNIIVEAKMNKPVVEQTVAIEENIVAKPAGIETAEKVSKEIKLKEETIKKKPAQKKKTTKKVIESKRIPESKANQSATKQTKEEKKSVPVKATGKNAKEKQVHISFTLKFHTKFGQSLFITGNHELFGNNDPLKALPMQYLNEEYWTASIALDTKTISEEGIVYNYLLRYEDGYLSFDWGSDKVIKNNIADAENILISDSWNHAGFYENAFYSEAFKNVLLKKNYTPVKIPAPKNYTHTCKVKAPLLEKGETLCIIGNTKEVGNWDETKPSLMGRGEDDDFFTVNLDLSKANFPVVYKYGIYNTETKKFIGYEGGNNRVIFDAASPNKKTIVNDGFAVLPDNTWKGAGIAIPVFSLRSNESCGIGEFTDLKLLVDWARKVDLKLIQILPVNDTTATRTWVDSYPYAAISAFALHPMFLHLESLLTKEDKNVHDEISAKKLKLNTLDSVDYEAVNNFKWKIIRQIYPAQKNSLFGSNDYKNFFENNKDWLVPYAAFCFLRDKNKTADFSLWPLHKTFNAEETSAFFDEAFEHYDDVAIHFFIQYHLHKQLHEATLYAHENGIILKGDIPIGIYRNGADAWQQPELYHMDMQAGAPPDDFAVTGQNWSFPTYNWSKMREDGFTWWKQRFAQMSNYYDAFRIDHILGFFRIWSIPMNSVEGIMGHFEPAIPVYINEFNEKNIWFNYHRYCNPFINDQIIWDTFGEQQQEIKNTFLALDEHHQYIFKPEYNTQRSIENYFLNKENNENNQSLKEKLFGLISNVILFEVEGSKSKQFHFRFGIETTSSFQNLEPGTRQQLKDLYINYFFERQDAFWMHEAMQKLPALKRVTNMLVCGEDLGLVPGCVPDVMRQLGLLSLEIQRMPKDPKREFFHPNDAPYMSVVTPSTHDMSTIRGWWEEDRIKTQRFYNFELGQWGDAPHFCEAWVNKAIVIQHLYSPAMWSIFQMQDLLGIDKKIRRENPHEERINVPANPKHYWKYRMHITLENLLNAEEYNEELKANIKASGR